MHTGTVDEGMGHEPVSRVPFEGSLWYAQS
jgi:hypothetical protein